MNLQLMFSHVQHNVDRKTSAEILIFPNGGFFFPNGIERKIRSGDV
jgi:hypothetical protein